MNVPPRAAWTLARAVAGCEVNGEADALPEPYRAMVRALAGAPDPDARATSWLAMAAARPELVQAVADVDPEGPPPMADEATGAYATLADVSRIVADQPWLWPGWLARGVLNVVASDPGIGKTRLGLDLARRLWFGQPWPDGQANDLPPESRTLWVQADQAFPEMLQAARDFGLPEDAVALGAPPDEPTGSLDLDDPEALRALGERIRAAAPALVTIDTVGMTTARNLCRPEEARAFFGPILELARSSGVAFLGLTHLSKDKEALGRRIVEKARVIIKMTQPDPEGQPNRRRLWVDKTAVTKPPPLGITMGGSGNDYDHTPPVEPEGRRGPADGADPDRAAAWLRERLKAGPVGSNLCASEGDRAMGRPWPPPGSDPDRAVASRVKWWRESVLKPKLDGRPRKLGMDGPWFFTLPDGPWPPPTEAVGAAREADPSDDPGPAPDDPY